MGILGKKGLWADYGSCRRVGGVRGAGGLAGGVVGVGDGASGRIGDAGDASVEIVSVGGGLYDAVRGALFGDDVAARIIAPGFPARGVAHGGAAADGSAEVRVGEQPLMVVLS